MWLVLAVIEVIPSYGEGLSKVMDDVCNQSSNNEREMHW